MVQTKGLIFLMQAISFFMQNICFYFWFHGEILSDLKSQLTYLDMLNAAHIHPGLWLVRFELDSKLVALKTLDHPIIYGINMICSQWWIQQY